ncbi:MAG: ribosome maturation factor RimM [Actinomycetota bacterium]
MYTDSPNERFAPGSVVQLQVPETSQWFGKSLTVRELRWYNNLPVVFFEGIEDRTVAESLIKAILLVEQQTSQLPVEPDAWYDHQLVGLKVIRDGQQIGEVVRVDHLPAQDLLAIQTDDKEVLLPFVRAFVPKVDVDSSTIEITPPGGLFEELSEEKDEG